MQLENHLCTIELLIFIRLFDHTFHNNTVLPLLKAEVGPDFREVDGCSGLTVKCGDTDCIFEFVAYKYIGGTLKEEEQPKIETLEDLIRRECPEYDNDQPIFVGPPDIQRETQQSETDLDSTSPLTVHQPRPIKQTVVPLDVEGQSHSAGVQRQNTVDYSPQAREQKRRSSRKLRKMSSQPAGAKARMDCPNNDLQRAISTSECPDENRREYFLKAASSKDECTMEPGEKQPADNAYREQTLNNGAGESLQTMSSGASNVGIHWSKQRMASSKPLATSETHGSHSRDAAKQRRSSSSTRPLLSSIDESGTNDENESTLTSPPPVFSDS